MKRGRGESLTGGTRDVNPQFLHMLATQSGADATTTTTFPIPVQRLPTAGKSQVMEVLKVFAWFSNLAEVDSQMNAFFSTKSFGTTATTPSEPTVFAAFQRSVALTTSGQIIDVQPYTMDLEDSAGHGFIVATDNIFLQVASTTTSATNTVRAKIYYRWKNVGLAEYVGVVQSQQ